MVQMAHTTPRSNSHDPQCGEALGVFALINLRRLFPEEIFPFVGCARESRPLEAMWLGRNLPAKIRLDSADRSRRNGVADLPR